MGKKALVLGGGAPTFTLMSGALLALHRRGVTFDVISMAGAGSVVGLVYLAPKDLSPEQALENTVNYGISDLIYSMFPVNYKLFSKGGPSAKAFREYWQSLPPVQAAMQQYGMNERDRLYSDWLLYTGAMMCPSDTNYFSGGLCAHAPFIDGVVDFSKLQNIPQECFLNAYCIEDRKVVEFTKSEINAHHFRAALSFPFIYPPYPLKGKHYYEGAAIEPLNLAGLVAEHDIKTVVLFDILTKELIHRPKNLWDAYGQSIIVPVVANADKDLDIFLHWAETGYWVHDLVPPQPPTPPPTKPDVDALVVKFSIPEERWPYLLDWSSSNLHFLFDVGYEAGEKFYQENESKL